MRTPRSEKYSSRARSQLMNNQARASHERWLVSYADFMTLLMAFFVVMYSISQVSEEKYRVLSETFTEAFSSPKAIKTPLEQGDPQLSHTKTPIDLNGLALEDRPGNDANDVPEDFIRINEQLEQSFETLLESELITVNGDERWLEIELQSGILFESGGATLGDSAAAIISELSQALLAYSNVIRVEGFTDNVPITTSAFASNWELSAARASAVVKQLMSDGISPQRLAAVGYGEHQPVVSNNSAEGRARNRRIVLMVSTQDQLRPQIEQVESVQAEPVYTSPYQQREPLAEGELVHGLGQTARQQAEAWLMRNTATDNEIIEQNDAASVNTSGNNENTSTSNNNGGEAPALENIPGIKQVVLDNGALIFVSE